MTWHVSLTAWIYPGIYIFISFNFHFTKRADGLTKMVSGFSLSLIFLSVKCDKRSFAQIFMPYRIIV